MASNKNQEREARERLKLYNARQGVHEHRVKRRRRDNIIAVLGALVVIALAAATQIFYFSAGPGVPEATPSASATPEATGENVGDVPDADTAESRAWTGELTLNDIPLGITLDGALAPQAAASLIGDIQNGYLVGKTCHRLADSDGFKVLQCGSLDGTGATDASYSFGPIENAPADDVYPTGTIAMARVGDDAYSNGHQFFIVFGDTTIPSDTAGGYTVVGQVTSGLDALQSGVIDAGIADGAADGAPVVATTITAATIQ
ncbi:peptidylprolyl isomerase [Conyzicola sp.]|uniref:peptidylprolyl isomerase n=1 Tax=Conyzicola sp. TaxID=1969404 RepID=UPI00398917B8